MPRTRSASARAAGGREGRHEQEQQSKQQPKQQEGAKELVAPPALSNTLVSDPFEMARKRRADSRVEYFMC